MQIKLPNPTSKQKLFLKDQHKNVAFGGARGGGKSFAIRLKAVMLALKHPGISMMIIRKTYPELIANHIKPFKELLKIGSSDSIAKYNDSKKEITFLNGSEILFRYCDAENDVDHFQGTEVDILFLDEATQLSEDQMKKLCACVRGVNKFPKRVYYTCNPGGKGHSYIKRLFIDKVYEAGEDPEDFSFIQSLVTDNKILMENDPSYLKRLEALPPKLREAWLNGRWDVFEGAFFEEFRATPDAAECEKAGISTDVALREHRWTHVIEPFIVPDHYKIYRAYDFGYSRPFALLWIAVSPDDTAYVIAELYGGTGIPNEGLKWTPEQQFREIKRIEDEHPLLKGKRIYGVADPSIWDGSRGISIVEEAEKWHIWFEKGVNDRIAGWSQIHQRLFFDSRGFSKLYFFNTCKDIIRTIPLMMYSTLGSKIEDLDSSLEDHACDALRYFAMLRKVPSRKIEQKTAPKFDPLEQFNKDKAIHNTIFRR